MITKNPAKRELEDRVTILKRSVVFLIVAVLVAGVAAILDNIFLTNMPALAFTGGLAVTICGASIACRRAMFRLEGYEAAERAIASAIISSCSAEISDLLGKLEAVAARDGAIRRLYVEWASSIEQRLNEVLEAEAHENRRLRVALQCANAKRSLLGRVEQQRLASPAIRAERAITDAIENITRHRAVAEARLDEQRERKGLKWWFALTRPGFEEVDAKIEELEAARVRLIASGAFAKTEEHFRALAALVDRRTAEIERAAFSAIPEKRHEDFNDERIVQSAMLLSALSIPVSAWHDFNQAGNVFDSLREVNGNYAGMSDAEIWFETLTMPGPELAGLANLTKGALFEKHVEAEFAGERFEHFNHPDTDIVIDGVAYQIKATDSASYVESVADDIPVISTSEIAGITGSIDGGCTNEELTDAVDLALGGTVIDLSDTVLDALFAGVGGVGVFAMAHGVRSASAKYKASGDVLEATAAGVGATATSTARSAVNMAEIATKSTIGVVKSKPIRFLGRFLAMGVERFDQWLE
jgi:hypothetical protein